MEDKEIVFSRNWTDLGRLQPPSTCHYALTVTRPDGGRFGVAVGQGTTWRSGECWFGSLRAALRVLHFLYENGVTPVLLPGVIQDLRAQELLNEEVHV